jgi:hypothetical protein
LIFRAAAKLALIAGILASAGCHTFHFHVSDAPYDPTPVVDRKTFWFFAMFPLRDVDVRAFCPEGVSAIEEKTTFSDGLFSSLTLGIYSPRTSYYYCRLPRTAGPPDPTS